MLGDHIPNYVLQLFEQHQGGRTGLGELTVLAATLEDVVHGDAVSLLSTAYSARGRYTAEEVHGEAERSIVTTHILFQAMPDPVYAELSIDGLNTLFDEALTFWGVWPDRIMWAQDLRDALKYSVSSGRSPFVDRVARPRNFYDLVRWVEGVGENYRRFQNIECRGMKMLCFI